MKTNVGTLKKLVKEEYMRGVPDHVLRSATSEYVENVRRQVFRYILANKSRTPSEKRQALAAANVVLGELEKQANDLLEEKLWAFMRNV